MVDTLDASINKMKTLQTEARGVDSAFADVRQRVQSLDIELLKSVKVANQLKNSFDEAADKIIKARQEMHTLQNRVFEATNVLKNMDSQLNRVGISIGEQGVNTQVSSEQMTQQIEVLNKLAESMGNMEATQKSLLILSQKEKLARQKAAEEMKEQAKEAEEAAKKVKTLTAAQKALGLEIKDPIKGTFFMEVNGEKVTVDKFGREVNRVGEVITDFNKRTQVLTKTIETLNKGQQGFKPFEIFSFETLEQYRKAGGNIFEYMAEALSGTREEITIFGIEGAKFRKIMYGFFPPGTFRTLNRFSSVFQTIGSAIRRMGNSGEQAEKSLQKLQKIYNDNLLAGVDINSEEMEELQENISILKDQLKASSGGMIGTLLKQIKKLPTFGLPDKADFGRLMDNPKKTMGLNLESAWEMTKKVFLAPWAIAWKQIVGSLKFFNAFGKQILQFVGKAFITITVYATLLFMAIFFFRKPIMKGLEFFGEVFAYLGAVLFPSLQLIGQGIGTMFRALMEGDIFKFFYGFAEILIGVAGVAVSAALAFFGTLPLLALSMIVGLYEAMKEAAGELYDNFKNGEFVEIVKKASVVLLGIMFILGGFPLLITTALTGVVIAIIAKLGNLIRGRFMAEGGVAMGGLTVVGERGPELVNLPAGSRVHSNQKSRGLVGGSSTVNNFSITINAKDTSKAEMRRIADEIGKQINQKMNRKRGANVV